MIVHPFNPYKFINFIYLKIKNIKNIFIYKYHMIKKI